VNQQDRPEYTAFVAARHAALFRTAYLITGEYHQAEDLLQAALTKAFVSWSKVSSAQNPEAYVRRIIVNQSVSWRRRRSSGEVPTAEIERGMTSGPEGRVTESDETWRALATLPRQQRAVLVLRYYEDMSEAEIAEALGIARGTVKAHASKALRTLASRLGADLPRESKEATS
jgi:RNA polymerase sigma-70 factor, ECF subfamily